MTTAEICGAANVSDDAKALLQDDMSPSKYINLLSEKGLYKDAIGFLAHGLPVPVSIQWASACVKEFQPPEPGPKATASLAAAEKWIESPSDQGRWEAKKAADDGEMSSPADCLAMGVFFSGGSVTPPEAPPTPAPPYSAQKLVAGSIMMAGVSHAPEKANDKYRRALDIGREMVKAPA